MRTMPRLPVAVLLLALIAADKSQPKMTYLAPADVDWLALLPAPPTKDSAETKAEIQQVRGIEPATAGR